MNINNKKVINKMVDFMLSNIELLDIIRYYNEFKYELDYNIYQYGNLDIMDWELENTLRSFGVTKTFKNKNDLRSSYMYLVRLTTNKIMTTLTNKLKTDEVML